MKQSLSSEPPSIASVIQEIVSLPGWSIGNSLVIIVTGTGERTAESYDGKANAAPLLHVEYVLGSYNPPPSVAITAPTNGSAYTTGTSIDFSGTASDAEDGDITANLSWTSSLDGIIGSGGSFSITTLSEGVHTVTAAVMDSGGSSASDTITVSVNAAGQNTVAVDVRVAVESDDAEEKASGSVRTASSDLELVFDKSDQYVGMRFNGLGIPQGATIVDAYVQFQVDEVNSVSTALTLKGEAIDNAPIFTVSSGNISSRNTTTSQVSWNPAPWTTVGEAVLIQRTPNIAPGHSGDRQSAGLVDWKFPGHHCHRYRRTYSGIIRR